MTQPAKGRVSRALLLMGMGLLLPCLLFTVLNLSLIHI